MDIESYLLGKKASGGGGGSSTEYEEGTYTTEQEIVRAEISFTKSHTEPPVIVLFYDIGEPISETKTFVYYMYADTYKIFGGVSGNNYYGTLDFAYYYNSNTSYQQINFTHSSDTDLPSPYSDQYYPKYWVTNEGFKAGMTSTIAKLKPNRTYKWIAIWK